jgi:hypothetical protein
MTSPTHGPINRLWLFAMIPSEVWPKPAGLIRPSLWGQSAAARLVSHRFNRV